MLFQSQIIQLGKKNSEEGGRWDGWTERWDVRRRREESIQQCNFTAENVLFSFSAFFSLLLWNICLSVIFHLKVQSLISVFFPIASAVNCSFFFSKWSESVVKGWPQGADSAVPAVKVYDILTACGFMMQWTWAKLLFLKCGMKIK